MPKSTYAQAKALRESIVNALLSKTDNLKEIPNMVGCSLEHVRKVIWLAGYRSMLVSPEERQAILKAREARACLTLYKY